MSIVEVSSDEVGPILSSLTISITAEKEKFDFSHYDLVIAWVFHGEWHRCVISRDQRLFILVTVAFEVEHHRCFEE